MPSQVAGQIRGDMRACPISFRQLPVCRHRRCSGRAAGLRESNPCDTAGSVAGGDGRSWATPILATENWWSDSCRRPTILSCRSLSRRLPDGNCESSSRCWDEGPRRTQFRLECGEPGQCLPFLVYLRRLGDVGARTRASRIVPVAASAVYRFHRLGAAR